jgi:hypothetical protein
VFREYPDGMEAGALWQPYAQAKRTVELYPEGPQEPGCEVSLIRHDPEAAALEFHLGQLKLPSACPRFASRACPRMEGMGHEPSHPSCNYWDYPRMVEFTPGLELYPEWQRFDCHKYYALFQAHLVGAQLALDLACRLKVLARVSDRRLLEAYASLTSDPSSFSVLP